MTRPNGSADDERRSAEQEPPLVIRDKRKFDSDGNRRDGSAGGFAAPGRPAPPADASEVRPDEAPVPPAATAAATPAADQAADQAAELTKDLQRVTAEYANYRKRVDRDRVVLADVAAARIIEKMLPVLDDIERADQHGDLSGAFKAVADKFVDALNSVGLSPFGVVGDRFDPEVHEAVMHGEGDDVTAPTATTIMRRGYRLNDRLIRPAMVGVTDPASAAPVSVDPADLSLEPGAD